MKSRLSALLDALDNIEGLSISPDWLDAAKQELQYLRDNRDELRKENEKLKRELLK